MKTVKDLELKILLRESHIQQLNLYIEQLENQINKAIEFLNNECLYDKDLGYCDDLYCGEVQELVRILKGDEE